MVFACSTVSEYACKSVGPGRPRADCWPATVADLFNFILPFLKSDLHCTAVVMVKTPSRLRACVVRRVSFCFAHLFVCVCVCVRVRVCVCRVRVSLLGLGSVCQALALCNGSAYDVLFETLRPYEQEYTRRRRKGVDQLRNHISCTPALTPHPPAAGEHS